MNGEWDSDLLIEESLGEICRGTTPNVNIEIINPTGREIFINKNVMMGDVFGVAAIIPVNLFHKENQNGENLREGDVKMQEMVSGMEVKINNLDLGKKRDQGNSEKWMPNVDLSHLTPSQKKILENVLWEECEVFSKSELDIGEMHNCQMDIKLLDDIPVNEPHRNLPRKLYEDVKIYLNDMILNGWIQESDSAYASPIVCVRKKDNSIRLCVDYRKLNLKTVSDKQPIPRVQEFLDGLGGQKCFSTLDMAKTYHQGFVKEECRKYTAFSTPWALYEFVRIPFGLKNSPAVFQRYINQSLVGLRDVICLVYLDDILCYGKTFEEHVKNLAAVLKCLKSRGIKLRPDKCNFCKPEVRYLGRLISENGYRPDPKDTESLNRFREPPKTMGELRTLLGFLGYYRSYVIFRRN